MERLTEIEPALGPLGKCNAIYKLTIVDYEVVVDRYLGPGCS